jgi:hypothetical protein
MSQEFSIPLEFYFDGKTSRIKQAGLKASAKAARRRLLLDP